MIDLLYLVGGFVVLFLSGRYLVTGGVQLARFLNIPPMVVGLTIISFGTSAPELLVSLKAALSGSPEISMGNVIGSNLSNIGLVLGLTALIFPIPANKGIIRKDWPVMMLATVLMILFSLNGLIQRWEGIIFLLILIAFNVYTIKTGKSSSNTEKQEAPTMKWYWALSLMVIACIGLVFGSGWLVDGAKNMALDLGVSERIVSVSIIAFGTSVPELATSIVAAFKRETDIALGNIIGSNIFNILAILGITSIVKPVPVGNALLTFDMPAVSIMSILLFVLLFIKRRALTLPNGLILMASYALYLFLLLK
jgi:cation:H+ antiporter